MMRSDKVQLKFREIKEYRDKYKKEQEGVCALCKCDLSGEQEHLDHSHETGFIRGTLCRACNYMEGKVINSRYRAKREHLIWTNPVLWVFRLYRYLKQHKDNPTNIYHPSFDVEESRQKRKKRKKK